MDFISLNLTILNQPTGFWQTILGAFKGALGTYMLAVILLAVIVRVLFSLVDIINKKVTMKTSAINEKMRPEMEAIQRKYGNDKVVMQQKMSELQKKYGVNMMAGCLPMLLTLVLQFTVFLTLWSSLQSVANFNIAEKYENMKNVYANVVNLNTNEAALNSISYAEGDELSISIDIENNSMTLKNVTKNYTSEALQLDLTWDNESVYNLLKKYVIVPNEEDPEQPVESEEATPGTEVTYTDTGYNEILKTLAEQTAEKYYLDNQEGFLWIKNVYKSESPTSPLFTKSEIKNYLSGFYSEEEKVLEEQFDYEGQIFDYVVTAGIGQKDLGCNGYYILTIIAVLSSFLSIWLSNKLMGNKNNPQGQSKMMYFIMPIIFGIFTFMYTSLFAIYIIVGQLVMMALTPFTTWVVKKWNNHDLNKKKEQEVVEVDYRRKDI
ncbi:MAG: YidC/Oxa1 family membrane protein insertase [Candidatus Caccovivens sp.]